MTARRARLPGGRHARVRQAARRLREWFHGPLRGGEAPWLWPLLVMLVVAVLATLVWLASMYETAQAQEEAERSAAVASLDIRQGLARNLESLRALQTSPTGPTDDSSWAFLANTLLYERRELMLLRWLDTDFRPRAQAESPYGAPGVSPADRQLQTALACSLAAQSGVAQYSASFYAVAPGGLGQELIDVCQPIRHGSELSGYQVATYSLRGLLAELIAKPAQRTYEVSFTDPDGARLAVINTPARRASRAFSAQQVIDLPGASLTLKLVYWHAAPSLFPNVLTAVVTLLTIALISVVSLLAQDMRRRRRAEQEVADALALRQAMENSLVTGLRARDMHGRISYVNPAFCEMVGLPAEQLLGSGMPAPYWPPESVEIYLRRQEAQRADGRQAPRIGHESTFMRRDGTRFPVLIYEAPLLDAQGRQSGWMSAVIDVSEQRRIEEISRASQERLQATARLASVGEMASLISHEINQPLAAISSYAAGSLNLLRAVGEGDGPDDGAALTASQARAVRGAVEQIVAQAERAGKVVTSVRDFVQRRQQDHEPLLPCALQAALEPLLTLQARKLGVALEWNIPPELPAVRCDRTMVEQVLLNLARNGMQAMAGTAPALRRLVIRAERQPGATDTVGLIRFSVADFGSGIAPELADHLFTHFFSTKRDGMGLGLSLCRTVVEQHGGQLLFEPNPPCGTIFSFTLPLHPAPAPEAPAAAPPLCESTAR
ncbi:MAG: PAS domain S-box protein [Comamonas sp.]